MPDALWFDVRTESSDMAARMVTSLADPAVVALLVPALRMGRDIAIEGRTSAELIHGVTHGLQDVLTTVMVGSSRIQVRASQSTAARSEATGVATGFSGGVDSWTTLADYHYSTDVVDSYRITHLIYDNVSYGPDDPLYEVFGVRRRRIIPFVKRIGLPLITIDSNVGDFFRGHDIVQTHTLRHSAVAFLLQEGIRRWHYSAGYRYGDVRVAKCDAIARCDPVLLPLLSTPALDLRSAGGEYSRVEKTLKLADLPDARASLDVCVETPPGGGNCSVCWKCLRTELTLEIGGVLDQFTDVFDLAKYGAVRDHYLSAVLGANDPLSRQIRDFAAERGFKFPRRTALAGAARRSVPPRIRWVVKHPRTAATKVKERVFAELARL